MFLPLFPLNSVLFPGEELPLHIFEPRYRQMINTCREQERPFGVVLIRSGSEVGGTAEPHRVGTTARITSVEPQPDGRMNILTRGERRFRIRSTSDERPYLSGEVELLDDYDGDSGEAHAAATEVRALYLRFFQITLALRGEWARRVATPRAPGQLADTLAARLPADMEVKQLLLEDLSVPHRLSAVAVILDAGVTALEPRAEVAKRMRYGAFAALN